MENKYIVSKMNTYLHKAADALVIWLEEILPRVADSWWDDCVLSSLSYTQRENAIAKGLSKLSDFDLTALFVLPINPGMICERLLICPPQSER